MSFIDLFKRKVQKWTERSLDITIEPNLAGTERIGTGYGGWIIPQNWLNTDSIVYGVGAGEDLSFDAGISEKYGCSVHIFDPTPRAKIHFDQLIYGIKLGIPAKLANTESGMYPELSEQVAQKLKFHPFGVWNKDETIKFFAPENEAGVSHSIVNLSKTTKYFEAPVKPLKSIMQSLGHNHIDLLKLDIEGAEYAVLEHIIQENLDVRAVCIEYDEKAGNNMDAAYLDRIELSLKNLVAAGFRIIAKEPKERNYTLIKV